MPLNESWGVPRLGKGHAGQLAFVERVVALTRRLDGTRPVIDNDGWEHTNDTDVFAIHDYTARGEDLRARYAGTVAGGPMVDQGWGEHPVPYFAPGARYRGPARRPERGRWTPELAAGRALGEARPALPHVRIAAPAAATWRPATAI